jgi:hypothetical protein
MERKIASVWSKRLRGENEDGKVDFQLPVEQDGE